MTAEDCSTCAGLRESVAIRTPDHLTKALTIIRSYLRDGAILDITQPAHSPSGDFMDLPEVAPWPDYIEHYFRCSRCGRGFRLAVDTYHGSGGEWGGEVECF